MNRLEWLRIGVVLALAVAASGQVPSANSFRVRPSELQLGAIADGPTPQVRAVLIGSLTVGPTAVEIQVDAGSNNTLPPDWLRVRPRRATTPARIRVEVTRTDLAPGEYRARLLPRLVVGAQAVPLPTVDVRLRVFRSPAELEVAPQAIRLNGKAGGSAATQEVGVRNRGSGGVQCRSVAVRTSEPWLRASNDQIGCRITVSAFPQTLAPGPYSGTVTIETPIGNREIPVSFQVYSPAPRMLVFPLGLQFEARQGNNSPQTRGLTVANIGDAEMRYAANIVDASEGAWIRLMNPAGISRRGSPGSVTVGVSPVGVAPGSYHALVRIVGEGARNSPMLVPIVLNVAPSNAQAVVSPSPSGLVFNVEAHTGESAPQVVTVFNSTDTPVPFQASAQALDTERNWLRIQPASGQTSTSTPAKIEVTVDPLGLNAGTFEGQLNTFLAVDGELEIRTVNVTLVVRPQGIAAAAASTGKARAAGCEPKALSLTHTGLVTNFLTRAGWPTPLNVRLIDDCGQPATEGAVLLTFSNGDPPLALEHLREGNYAGTWTPLTATAEPVSVRTEAIAAGGLTATFDLVGSVAEQTTPVLAPNGVLSNFAPIPGAPLAPGMIVQIYGTGLAGGTLSTSLEEGKLPVVANDVLVLIGGVRAPLYFLSPGQINAQIPFELEAGDEHLLLVRSGRAYSVPIPIGLAARQPGLATLPDGTALAQDQGFQLVTPENPAVRGGYIVLYLVGLGATNPPVPSAEVSPGPPDALATLTPAPDVLIDGKRASVVFAGLTPAFVGLYQLNVQVPEDIQPGLRDLVVVQAGVESNLVKLPVK